MAAALIQLSIPGFSGHVGHVNRSGLAVIGREFKAWMWKIQAGKCGYCGVCMTEKNRPSVDHIIPRIKRGSHLPPNLLWACRACNSAKKDRNLVDFRLILSLRNSDLQGVISSKQAQQLLRLGISLPVDERQEFHFEKMDWAHLAPAISGSPSKVKE